MSQQYPSRSRERQSEYNKQYYRDHAERFQAYVKKRWHERTEIIQQLKTGMSCTRCGNDDIRVLDFHHLDRTTKEASVSDMIRRGWGKDRIIQEIAKCEVLCANCHRILHWEERNEG